MTISRSLRVLLIGDYPPASQTTQTLLAPYFDIELKIVPDVTTALREGTAPRLVAAYDVALLTLAGCGDCLKRPARTGAAYRLELEPIQTWVERVPQIPLVVIADCHNNECSREALVLDVIRAGAQDCFTISELTGHKTVETEAGDRELAGAQLRRALYAAHARHRPESGSPHLPTSGTSHSDSEARLRAIIESEPECVKLVSPDGKLLDMNPAGLRMIEADTRSQVINLPIQHLIHPVHRKDFFDLHRRVMRGESGELQFQIVGLKGTERWMETHSTPLRESNGEIAGVLSITRDITERKNAEEVMLRIAHAVSMPIGPQFLEQLVGEVIDVLNATAGLIALLEPGQSTQVRTQTYWLRGQALDNVCYDFRDTPCEPVLQGEISVYTHDLASCFPKDTMLAENGLESYVGAPLYSQAGELLGLVAVLYDRPLPYRELALFAIRILAARTAAELERQTVDSALVASRRRTQLILESVGEGILGLDADSRITFVNPAALQMLGWSEHELRTRNAHVLLHHHHLATDGVSAEEGAYAHAIQGEGGVCPILQTLRDGKRRRVAQEHFLRRDGSSFMVRYECAPITDSAGRISGAVLSFADISEFVEDQLLRETEKEILEYISSGRPLPDILHRTIQGIEELCPGGLASIALLDAEGESLREVLSLHLPAAFCQSLAGWSVGPKAGSCGTAAWRRRRVIVSDILSDPLWEDYLHLVQPYGLAACWATPILDGAGKPIATFAVYYKSRRAPQERQLEHLDRLGYLVGISLERARDQQALKASEESFRHIFQLAAVGMGVTSIDGYFLRANAAYSRMLGYTVEEMQRLRFSDVTHPDDRFDSEDYAKRLRAHEIDRYSLEKRYLHKSGKIVWVRLSVTRLEDADGRLVGHIAVAEDITQAKKAQSELAHSQGLLRAASRLGRLGGWAIELGEEKIVWSDEVCIMLDMPLGTQPTREDIACFYTPESLLQITEAVDTCSAEGTPFDLELEANSSKGRRFWVRVNGEAVRDQQGRIVRIQGAFQDISERKAADQTLRQSEERFKLFARATNDVIWDMDIDSDTTWWNENLQTVLGYDPATELRDSGAWLELVHPGDRASVRSELERALESEETMTLDEYRVFRRDGSIAYIYDRAIILRDETGRPVRVVGGKTDITQRKQLESQILRAQRLESLGILAGGIAHDLNNVLTPIMLATFLLKKSVSSDEARKQLEVIEETAGRGAEMVRQVLTFARGSSGQEGPVEVDMVAQEVVKLMEDTLQKKIQLSLIIGETPWKVLGDSTQIHQVMVNLCVNARDAMPDGGRIEITIENFQVDGQFASMIPNAKPGPYVRVCVTDTGIGIPRDLQDRIFDPFFTTKPTGQGTGLGLSTVQGLVHGHGGFIKLHSQERRGTRFEIFLPALHAEHATAAPLPIASIPAGDGELILVVDDEKPLRLITQQTLETYGYRVLLAEDGAQALSIYVQHQDEIALVLTDMMMPVMDGFATIQALYRINPRVLIVGASGMAAAGLAVKAAQLGVVHFLAKPYTAESMMRTLAQALGKI